VARLLELLVRHDLGPIDDPGARRAGLDGGAALEQVEELRRDGMWQPWQVPFTTGTTARPRRMRIELYFLMMSGRTLAAHCSRAVRSAVDAAAHLGDLAETTFSSSATISRGRR
jgi:hypothetical protein